nr:hypothetical protein [uncultured Flavobacterium sp.]
MNKENNILIAKFLDWKDNKDDTFETDFYWIEKDAPNGLNRIQILYNNAVIKSKKIGGKKYRGKDFGGGIVIQSYNIDKTIQDIQNLNK